MGVIPWLAGGEQVRSRQSSRIPSQLAVKVT